MSAFVSDLFASQYRHTSEIIWVQFHTTVTMRILKSISLPSLLQILKCFKMKNGSGGRSQGRGREDMGEVRTGNDYMLEGQGKRTLDKK